MNYGLYLSTSGMLTKTHAMDVLSNNLANVNTAGFKPDRSFVIQRDPVRVEDGVLQLPSDRLLERLGAGSLSAPTRPDFTPGALKPTGNDFDLGVDGEGFFMIRTGPDDADVRLTRDGRFMLDRDGRLVRASDGRPVLAESGAEIRLDVEQPVSIDASGAVTQDGDVVANLALVSPAAPNSLVKEGANLFRMLDPEARTNPAGGQVRQGMLEHSGVDPVRTMTTILDTARAFERNARMIQIFDQGMSRAINTLGRVG
jgi:flagellar basal-body rod protein FlgG